MSWDRPFDDPISLPKGRTLVRLRDAANYIMALPKAKHRSSEWQVAAKALMMVAQNRGPIMHAQTACCGP